LRTRSVHLSYLCFQSQRQLLSLHSFPTRRSSDLSVSLVFGPPTGEVSEGPAEAEAPVETEAPVEREAAGEPGTRDVDAVVESAADRKSTRLNSSHVKISYAVFCLKKKKGEKI